MPGNLSPCGKNKNWWVRSCCFPLSIWIMNLLKHKWYMLLRLLRQNLTWESLEVLMESLLEHFNSFPSFASFGRGCVLILIHCRTAFWCAVVCWFYFRVLVRTDRPCSRYCRSMLQVLMPCCENKSWEKKNYRWNSVPLSFLCLAAVCFFHFRSIL